ncbi:MAG: hypothetical protein BZ138_06730, partial [Methanosphaera sp. rholeuAM270]
QYISYYDTSLSTVTPSYGFILENTVEYNVNYQYDILGELDLYGNATEYRNNYVAIEDDLIAGVGTYFEDSGVEYKIEIYVNDELKLTQNGVSPFSGFHTIKLDSYVSIKEGDVFTVQIMSNYVPVLKDSRQHYVKGASQYLCDGVWVNISTENRVCSIKAYTVADDTKIINNSDISVDYASDSFFTAKVVTADGHAVAGAPVGFTINGKTVNVTTDDEGIAKFEIIEDPGIYIVTTDYNNQSYQNIVTVNGVPDDDKKSDDESDSVNDNKPVNTKTIPVNYKSQTGNHIYTLYHASDMKMICQSNMINLKALIDLFEFNLTDGHLKVYIDETLVFDDDVGDDLSKVIIEIIEKFLGKHEIVVEFTDNNGEIHTLNETIIIK